MEYVDVNDVTCSRVVLWHLVCSRCGSTMRMHEVIEAGALAVPPVRSCPYCPPA